MTATNSGGTSGASTGVTMYTAISSSGLIMRYTGDTGTDSGTNLNNQLYTGNVLDASLNSSAVVGNTSVFKQGTGSIYFPTRAANLTGSNIKVNKSITLPSSGYISVSFWAYPTYTTPVYDWYFMFATSGGSYFGMQYAGSSTNLSLAVTGNCYGSASMTMNSWNHIVAIFSVPGTASSYIYKNNSLVSTVTTNNAITSFVVNNNSIGAQGQNWGDSTYRGYMDEFRVYTRQLSTAEISSLYNLTG
jgi:hypothetical protein